jgi:hypothetical protein
MWSQNERNVLLKVYIILILTSSSSVPRVHAFSVSGPEDMVFFISFFILRRRYNGNFKKVFGQNFYLCDALSVACILQPCAVF